MEYLHLVSIICYIILIFAKSRIMSDLISYGMTDDHILTVIGKQFRQMRINAGLSQEDLSTFSGITRKTISSIENGKSTSTGNIVALLRSLKRFDILSVLITPVPVSPIAAAKTGDNPQRMRSRKQANKINRSEW